MIEHLSAEQISQWMIGDRTPQLERHVAECDQCRADLEKLESTLLQFRGAARELGASAKSHYWQEPPRRESWFSWPRMAGAIATLALLIAVPVYWTGRVREQAAEQARADALLLERVDSSISRAVPEPMEPLVNLATWNSSPVEKKRKTESQ